MAFRFNWPEFDAGFYDEAKSQLEAALNKGNKPKNIVDHITVKELHMGTKVRFFYIKYVYLFVRPRSSNGFINN